MLIVFVNFVFDDIFLSASIDLFIPVTDVYLPSRLHLLQAEMQVYQQCCGLSDCTRRDQDVLLYGQLIIFFQCLLQKIVSKVRLPIERDWGAVHGFDFTGKCLWGVNDFMGRTQFRNAALWVVKATVDVERNKGRLKKKGCTHAVATAVDVA